MVEGGGDRGTELVGGLDDVDSDAGGCCTVGPIVAVGPLPRSTSGVGTDVDDGVEIVCSTGVGPPNALEVDSLRGATVAIGAETEPRSARVEVLVDLTAASVVPDVAARSPSGERAAGESPIDLVIADRVVVRSLLDGTTLVRIELTVDRPPGRASSGSRCE